MSPKTSMGLFTPKIAYNTQVRIFTPKIAYNTPVEIFISRWIHVTKYKR